MGWHCVCTGRRHAYCEAYGGRGGKRLLMPLLRVVEAPSQRCDDLDTALAKAVVDVANGAFKI